jgi:hypothetical protein
VLKYSTTQPITKIEHDGSTIYFFCLDGIETEYAFDATTIGEIHVQGGIIENSGDTTFVTGIDVDKDSMITIKDNEGRDIIIVTITREQALHAWKLLAWDLDRFFIANMDLYLYGDTIICSGRGEKNELVLRVFPAPEHGLQLDGNPIEAWQDGIFTRYAGALQQGEIPVPVELAVAESTDPSWLITIPFDTLQDCDELILVIDYIGNCAKLFVDDVFVADDFYSCVPWIINIKRWIPGIFDKKIRLEIVPLEADDEMYLEHKPVFDPGERELAKLVNITATRAAKVKITSLTNG